MAVVEVLCSHCGKRTRVPSFIGLERPLCGSCQRLEDELAYHEIRARVSCEKCPAKPECEEADRRGL